jgi:nicotinate-nucleotide pyrophosphorylase (carboxylating)
VSPFLHAGVRRLVRLALEEDLGRGDVTTAITIEPSGQARARIVARHPIVVAGLAIVPVVLDEARAEGSRFEAKCLDGATAGSDNAIGELRGRAADLLSLERVILNFLQRMCGVATFTRRFVEAVAGTRARIVDTRKTVPGWRLLDKYAVAVGGGTNHRFGLDDGILIKDNHIAACGGLGAAVERARRRVDHLLLRVEVECETAAQVDEALAAGADAILLDNMPAAEIAAAVRHIGGRALVEVSGGVSLATVRAIAEAGPDLISVGALTHSAPIADLAMDLAKA